MTEKLPDVFPQDLIRKEEAEAPKQAAGGPIPGAAAPGAAVSAAPSAPAVVQPQVQPAAPKQDRPPMTSDERGVLQPSTFGEWWQLASSIAASGMVPKQYCNNPAGVLAVLQTAKERGIGAMAALNNMANINGRTTGFGELPLGEVFRSGMVERIHEYWVDRDGAAIQPLDFKSEVFAAVCEIEIRGRGKIMRVFSLDDAKAAGLLTTSTKPDAVWFKYRKRMLQMRARGWALKDAAPDVIAGMAMPEYDEPGGESEADPLPAGPTAKEKLSNANRSQAQAGSEVTALPDLRAEAGGSGQPSGSVPCEDVRGNKAGSPEEPHPDVQAAPQPAARKRAPRRLGVPTQGAPAAQA